jgi:hypothetical protein
MHNFLVYPFIICFSLENTTDGAAGKGVRDEYGINNVYTCMQIQKWYLLKLFQESGERGWEKEVEGDNSSMINFVHCKKFCKCYSVPTPSTIIKKKGKWSMIVVKVDIFPFLCA